MIRLGPKTSVYEMNVTVVSTVTGCDVTTVQQHYKGFNKQVLTLPVFCFKITGPSNDFHSSKLPLQKSERDIFLVFLFVLK